MKKNTELRNKAITLRKQGKSYGSISKQLGVSKSTLSYWLKSVTLTQTQKKKLYSAKIRNMVRGPQSQHERRQKEIDTLINEAQRSIAQPLSEQTFRLFGAALYWAEGTKGGQLEITNSDPLLLLFMVRWFEKEFHVSPQILKVRLNMYRNQNEGTIKKFWSELLGIPLENFGKSYIKPLSKNVKNNNLYYGTLKVYVPKSTDLKHTTFGWIQGALQEHKDRCYVFEKKWHQLRTVERAVNLP